MNLGREKERVILVGVAPGGGAVQEAEASLEELAKLVEAAGAICVSMVLQNREQIHAATYVGKGKLAEIRELLWETQATGIVCDDELSPVQIRNLERELETKVMDRTLVILDIFALRAFTKEGKLQVELAQLRYRAARLIGLGNSLSRLGGGIGTRGPGEKKLETDRRVIQERIGRLKAELKQVEKHREVTRAQRKRNNSYVAAIVGYTNAGKSTLLNRLTQADVREEDHVFVTLDPTTRVFTLPGGHHILLTDTVGFIQKLPHHLVEAFHSTLEEAKFADIILHVVDASNPQAEMHLRVVYETLKQLGIVNKPVITLFNKADRLEEKPFLVDPVAEKSLFISARSGEGLLELSKLLEDYVRRRNVYVEKCFSYEDMPRIQLLREKGELLSLEYRGEGVFVQGYIPPELRQFFE